MAKNEKKIESIEEKIKRLQEQKKRLEQKQRTNVGKYLLETWGIEEESIATEVIDYLTPYAEEFLRNKSEKESSNVESTFNNQNVTTGA